MLSMLVALSLVLAPEKPIGPGDDFNDVIAGNERELHCEAVKVYKSEPDSMRLVVFSCAHGELLIPFIYQGEKGWFPIERMWTLSRPAIEGSAI